MLKAMGYRNPQVLAMAIRVSMTPKISSKTNAEMAKPKGKANTDKSLSRKKNM